MDQQIGVSSSAMRVLTWTVEVKEKLSQKIKLSIYWSVNVPSSVYQKN